MKLNSNKERQRYVVLKIVLSGLVKKLLLLTTHLFLVLHTHEEVAVGTKYRCIKKFLFKLI